VLDGLAALVLARCPSSAPAPFGHPGLTPRALAAARAAQILSLVIFASCAILS